MGARLRDLGLVPELIVSSTAVRAEETARLVAEAMGYEGLIQHDMELYLAEPEVIIERIGELDEVGTLMLVGHNPGLELLIERLTGREERFPTAALAEIRIDVPAWRGLRAQRDAELVRLWRPRELDPSA